MAQKRISRARKRDLEQPDEFLTLTARLLEKSRAYWKPLSACGVILFVILAGVLVAGYFSDQAEEKAFVLLNQAMNRYAQRAATRIGSKRWTPLPRISTRCLPNMAIARAARRRGLYLPR